MKRINNFNDLKYRKLYLQSEISIKEIKIRQSLDKLRDDFSTVDIKNELIQSVVNNPAYMINTARIAYDIVAFIKKHRKKKNKGNKK